MRVLVDAHMVGSQETGNETYIVELLRAMARLPGVECAAAVAPGGPPSSLVGIGVELLPLASANNWHRLAFGLPLLCRKWCADILHVTYVGPVHAPCPMVVTVHDVGYKRYPQCFSRRDRLLFATLLALSVRRAAAVITVSDSSRADIAEFYPGTEHRLHRSYEAAGESFKPVVREAALHVCKRYGVSGDFVLAVGNLQPRKNLLRILSAFRQLVMQGEGGLQLVLVGKDKGLAGYLQREGADLLETGRLLLTGYVPAEDLPSLYSAARVFVYPSLYEGFGLPVLEAMACGAPAIASNASSLPEVAGDAAILVDPFDVDAIASAMRRVLADRELALDLAQRGLKRASCFSWEKTAQETLAAYQAAIERWRKR